MSTNRPSKEVKAFHRVIEAYYACRSNPQNGGGYYATLSNSVDRATGKVRVCPSDLIADVESAGRRALRDYANEFHLFKRIYLDADTDFKDLIEKRFEPETWAAMVREIENRVGAAFIDAEIYPIQEYRQVVDTR